MRIPGRRGSMEACTRRSGQRETISEEDRPRVCSTPVATQEMGNTIVECLGFATPPVVLPPEEKERIEKAFDEISALSSGTDPNFITVDDLKLLLLQQAKEEKDRMIEHDVPKYVAEILKRGASVGGTSVSYAAFKEFLLQMNDKVALRLLNPDSEVSHGRVVSERTFDASDKDHNGELDAEEMKAMFIQSAELIYETHVSDAEIKSKAEAIVNELDRGWNLNHELDESDGTKDGKISKEEWILDRTANYVKREEDYKHFESIMVMIEYGSS